MPTLLDRFGQVRERSLRICEPLAAEDFQLQAMPDASPPKWHLAHTTWFFEEFLLAPSVPDYRPHHPQFRYLFNSYYDAVGARHPRFARGLISRPTVGEMFDYREVVDRAVKRWLAETHIDDALAATIDLGLAHEEQHQELLLTDLKYAFAQNPLLPGYHPRPPVNEISVRPIRWIYHPGGVVEIGHAGSGFAFDNESPRHRVYLNPFEIANRLITVGEYREFLNDGGYERPELWLSDGWGARERHGWAAPLYWHPRGEAGAEFTLGGVLPLTESAPVTHVSFYEADAYCRWAGARLPTEAEWETAAPAAGAESCDFPHPVPSQEGGFAQAYSAGWQWTASPYVAYPGYAPAAGRARRVQRQVHVQSDGPPRRVVRDFAGALPIDVPQLFPPGGAMAVHRHPAGPRLLVAAEAERFEFLSDVLVGLRKPQKELPCKYFYDEAGSKLFDQICDSPDYYPTRTELAIMRAHAPEMAAALGAGCQLVEYGSGSSLKTPLLLEQLPRPVVYVPVDVSGPHLLNAARAIARRFPEIEVTPVVADFTRPLKLPETSARVARRVVYFPGSTVGNFAPPAAAELLRNVARLVGPSGALLIGVDLKKDAATLERAYNDAAGVTAAFNLNLLDRINRELGADFVPTQFEHKAHYDAAHGRVEMHLVSRRAQTVTVGDCEIAFRPGETIHTENSHKYTLGEFRDLAARAGFERARVWTDAAELFSVQLYEL